MQTSNFCPEMKLTSTIKQKLNEILNLFVSAVDDFTMSCLCDLVINLAQAPLFFFKPQLLLVVRNHNLRFVYQTNFSLHKVVPEYLLMTTLALPFTQFLIIFPPGAGA